MLTQNEYFHIRVMFHVKLMYHVLQISEYTFLNLTVLLDNLRCENMIMGKTSKVVVCGTKKCGKTSLLEQIIYGKVGVSIIIEIIIINVISPQLLNMLHDSRLHHLFYNFSLFHLQLRISMKLISTQIEVQKKVYDSMTLKESKHLAQVSRKIYQSIYCF